MQALRRRLEQDPSVPLMQEDTNPGYLAAGLLQMTGAAGWGRQRQQLAAISDVDVPGARCPYCLLLGLAKRILGEQALTALVRSPPPPPPTPQNLLNISKWNKGPVRSASNLLPSLLCFRLPSAGAGPGHRRRAECDGHMHRAGAKAAAGLHVTRSAGSSCGGRPPGEQGPANPQCVMLLTLFVSVVIVHAGPCT